MKGGEEDLGEKLARIRKGSRRRGGPGAATPVLSSWSFQAQLNQTKTKDSVLLTSCVSARKLGAALWEFHNYYYYNLPLSSEMHRSNGAPPPPPPPPLPARQQQHRRHVSKDKGTLDLSYFLADDHQPESASSLTRHISASLMQNHRSVARDISDSSVVTPTSSLDFKRRIGKSHYNLKTSTELVKVLNRIWSLEEQHTSDVAVIRALKSELDHARVMMKDLVRKQQADRHEVDDLMKQTGEDKQVRKSKEQDRIHAAVQSMRDELEDERRLRKRSESLHRKLARDLSEVKSYLSNSMREHESERKSREFLEELCDEFAKGIKDYEQEVHILKQKSDKDQTGSSDRERLILHVSESWLDERMQMQLEQIDLPRKKSVAEKLSHEIENFLRTKHENNTPESIGSLLPRDRRRSSMESVLVNEVASAPQDAGEEDSLASDSNFFELKKPSNADFQLHIEEDVQNDIDEKVKSDHLKKKCTSSERVRISRSPSSLQVNFEEQMAWALICSDNKKSQVMKSEQGKSEEVKQHCEATEDETYERGNPSYMVRNHIRNHLFISDGDHVRPENNFNEASYSKSGWMKNQASPVKPWTGKVTSPGLDTSGTSSKLPLRKKENSLKAKLLEARSKGPRSTRTKALKSTSD